MLLLLCTPEALQRDSLICYFTFISDTTVERISSSDEINLPFLSKKEVYNVFVDDSPTGEVVRPLLQEFRIFYLYGKTSDRKLRYGR